MSSIVCTVWDEYTNPLAGSKCILQDAQLYLKHIPSFL